MDAPCSSNNLYAGGAAILAPYQFCDTYGWCMLCWCNTV
jgi:hypothetical protein